MKAGLRGALLPLDPPPSGALLQNTPLLSSPTVLYISCPLSVLCTRPWDAEHTLSNSADSQKQRVMGQRTQLKLQCPSVERSEHICEPLSMIESKEE
ncbi:hypothetical protein JOQ06_029312, partial [Pogonophryne albipinna]